MNDFSTAWRINTSNRLRSGWDNPEDTHPAPYQRIKTASRHSAFNPGSALYIQELGLRRWRAPGAQTSSLVLTRPCSASAL